MSDGQLPASPPQTPGFPNNPQPIVWDGFSSLNTHATRPAIDDQEMFICDGWMPLGKSNLRTLYGVGPVFYTAPAGLFIVKFAFGNIKATPICIVFLSDGSVIQVNTNTSMQTTMAPAGTIQNPSPTSVGLTQWGSQYIIIVSSQTNGYFLWDGALFYQSGSIGPSVNIISDGLDYSSAPSTAVVGGSGTGAAVSVTVQNGSVETISVTNPGHGYTYTDSVILAFAGGGSPGATAFATAVLSGTSVSSLSITYAGLGYSTLASISLLGGGGSGATATVTSVSGGGITGTSITAGGDGYLAPPTVLFTDFTNPVANATLSLMPFGVSGTAVETYQSRVWVANIAKVLFTAPGNVSDYSPADGAGAFTSVDSFLRVGFSSLKQTNGFLYLLADSSINYISGVNTAGNPPLTTFTNQNVDPQIGTPWPDSVQVFSRNIVFANSFGVQVSYGGAVTKVSPPMDIFFAQPALFAGFNPSSAVAVIFGIHVYMLLLPVIDQVTGQKVNKLLMWDGQRWWTAQQEINLLQITAQEINSVMTAWGTDGESIYPLFQQPSSTLGKTVQSKLWDRPGYFITKTASRVYGMVNYNQASDLPLTITLDDGIHSAPSEQTVASPFATWTNASGTVVTWTNASGTVVEWSIAGISVFGFASAVAGQILGLTLQTYAPDVTVISMTLLDTVRQANT